MLDPEDLTVMDARIEDAARAAYVAALDAVAEVLHAGVAPAAAARMLHERSHDVRFGTADWRAPVGLRLADEDVVDAEVEDEPAEGEAGQLVQALDEGTFGTSAILQPRDDDAFAPAMAAWLDLFDDRIRMDPCFVEAVNEAAGSGREANEETARLVGQRVRELRDAEEGRARPHG